MTKEGMGDEAMKKSLFYRAKKMPPSAQIMLLFAVEGVFLQYITSINGFGLNLYATNMGATDSQIGIIQMVPAMHFLEEYRHSARDVWSCFLYHWHLLQGHLLFTMRSGRQCSVLRFHCGSETMSMPFGISSCL